MIAKWEQEIEVGKCQCCGQPILTIDGHKQKCDSCDFLQKLTWDLLAEQKLNADQQTIDDIHNGLTLNEFETLQHAFKIIRQCLNDSIRREKERK